MRAAGLTIDPAEAARFEQYFELLSRWNAKINLTSLPLQNAPASTLDRLFIEPLIAAALVEDAPCAWFDIGSGGGSPAIPLHIVRPSLHLTMVDSGAKKTAFLREAAHAAGLNDTQVLTSRIEDVAVSRAGAADLVTVRAVRFDQGLAEAVRLLLKLGGSLLRFGARSRAELAGFRRVSERRLAQGEDMVILFERS